MLVEACYRIARNLIDICLLVHNSVSYILFLLYEWGQVIYFVLSINLTEILLHYFCLIRVRNRFNLYVSCLEFLCSKYRLW